MYYVKEFEFPLLRTPQNFKTENYERLVFEQEKAPVVQWLSFMIIQKLTVLLKVNIKVNMYQLFKRERAILFVEEHC